MFANKIYTKIALGIILLTVLTLSLPTGLTQAQQPVDRDNAPSCEDCDDHISPSTHSPQAYPFEVYNDISYSGTRCYSTQPETANIHSTCDDKISSVKLQSGWSARVYRDRNQGGPNVCLNSSDAGLQNNTFTNGDAMDNAISSFILYDEPWCASSPTPAYPLEVYTDYSYTGTQCYSSIAETENIHSTCNDKIKSILLRTGWSIRLYRDANQSGPSVCFNRSDAGLGNNTYTNGAAMLNTISSFVLYDEPWCGGPPTPAYPLEVYNDANYSGTQCYSSRAETANIHSTCNDKVTSILLRSGWSIKVYRDTNQSGPSRCLNNNDSNLSGNTYDNGASLNNSISSFILYDEADCGGNISLYSISGKVVDSGGSALSGVTVSDGAGHTDTTDSNGNYTLTGLNAGDYTITPSKSGYTFSPSSRSVSVPPNATGKNFTGSSLSSISGKVVDSGGGAVSGVTVSDGAGHTDTTDSNGNYTLTGLNAGDYTVTPSKSGYTFSPSSRSVSIPPNATGKNFTVINRYAISGRVTDGQGNELSDVPVAILGGPTVRTNSNGNYIFSDLRKKLYLLHKPSGSPYKLSPSVRIVYPNAHNQNFTTTPLYGSLTGKVTDKSTGKSIANARVSVGGRVGRTNSNGNYSISQILPGNHALRVSASGYKDYKRSVTIRAKDTTNRNVALSPLRIEGYRLPYPGGQTYKCTQGNNSSFSHHGKSRYAFDFGMVVGSDLVAVRDGKVIALRENYSSGGCNPAYRDYANWVLLQHRDGTTSLYVHLSPWSVPFSIGDEVRAGQVIGKSGQTGWSCGAHLHYVRRASRWSRQSIPTSFLDVSTNGGVPTYPNWYTSDNYPVAMRLQQQAPQEDTTPPRGWLQFRMTGSTDFMVQLDAFEYDSEPVEVRLAESEDALQTSDWQPLTSTVDWTALEVWGQFKDAAGNISDVYSDTIEAINYEPIQPDFTVNAPVCLGAAPQIENQTTPLCEQCGWEWDLGDGSQSFEINPSLPYPYVGYTSTGKFTVTLTVANVEGITSTSKQIEVIEGPSAAFTLSRSGSMVTVQAETIDAANWIWDFGDGHTASGSSIAAHVYTDTSWLNTYHVPVQLTVQGNNGCTSYGYQYIPQEKFIYLPLTTKN